MRNSKLRDFCATLLEQIWANTRSSSWWMSLSDRKGRVAGLLEVKLMVLSERCGTFDLNFGESSWKTQRRFSKGSMKFLGKFWWIIRVHPQSVNGGAALAHELTHSLQAQNSIDTNHNGGKCIYGIDSASSESNFRIQQRSQRIFLGNSC